MCSNLAVTFKFCISSKIVVEFDSRVIDIQLQNAQIMFERPFSLEVVDLSASGCQLFSVHMSHTFLEVKLVQISDLSKQFK